MKSIQSFSFSLHKDPRGYLFSPFEASELEGITPYHFHVYTIEPECMRGNHRHSGRNEYILSFRGKALLATFDPAAGKIIESHIFEYEEPSCAIVPATVNHCLYNCGKEPFVGASFSDSRGDIATDTFRSDISPQHLKNLISKNNNV